MHNYGDPVWIFNPHRFVPKKRRWRHESWRDGAAHVFQGFPTSSWGPDSARFPKEDFIKAIRGVGGWRWNFLDIFLGEMEWEDDGLLVQTPSNQTFGGMIY